MVLKCKSSLLLHHKENKLTYVSSKYIEKYEYIKKKKTNPDHYLINPEEFPHPRDILLFYRTI